MLLFVYFLLIYFEVLFLHAYAAIIIRQDFLHESHGRAYESHAMRCDCYGA